MAKLIMRTFYVISLKYKSYDHYCYQTYNDDHQKIPPMPVQIHSIMFLTQQSLLPHEWPRIHISHGVQRGQ
ncbi:hypothetical protein D3C73_970110 [compost metagenome]